jgi:hypothetical protein
VYRPTSHIFAILAGGPITFLAKDNQRVLTLEPFGNIVRLNERDYRLDEKSAVEIGEWLKEARGLISVLKCNDSWIFDLEV